MASSRHASDAASRPDSHHPDCRRDQRHGCRSHTSCSAKNRHAGVGARRDQDPRSRSQADLAIEPIELASTEAGKIALKGGSADLMLSDWLWVARERSLGDNLVFYPSSSTLGAVMVPAQSADPGASPISRARSSRSPAARSTRAGCCCRRWRAAPASISGSRRTIVYGAPPLLSQKALQGEIDATLTFWNFCADLESKGHKRAIAMDDVMKGLGAKGPVAIVGYTFDGGWARATDRRSIASSTRRARPRRFCASRRPNGSGLRRASASTEPSALAIYRQRYGEGIVRRPIAEEEADARALYRVLAEIGGAELVGPARELARRHVLPPPRGSERGARGSSRSRCCSRPGTPARSSPARGCCRTRRRSRSPSSTRRAPARSPSISASRWRASRSRSRSPWRSAR